MNKRHWAWCAAVGIAGGSAAAQDGAEKPPLSGPVVKEPGQRETLVETDFQGRVKRLEVPPEEAALKHVRLDEAAADKARAILAERAAILDKIVIENIELLVQFNTARQAGDKRDQVKLLAQFSEKAAPLTKRGPLGDELRGVMNDEQKAKFDALVNGYWDAIVAEQSGAGDMEGKARGGRKPGRMGIMARERLLVIGQEIKRSYERTVGQRVTDFEALVKELDLRPEQEAKIRTLVTDYAQKSKLNPNEAQKRELFRKIAAELDSEQQNRLLRYVLGRRAVPGG